MVNLGSFFCVGSPADMLNFRRVGHKLTMRQWISAAYGSKVTEVDPFPLKFALKVTHIYAPPFEHQHFDQHPLMLIIASP